MRRPRRLFRSSRLAAPRRTRRFAGPRTLAAGIATVTIGGLLILTGLPGDLFGRVPTLSGVISAEPRAVAVVDGNTLRLAETVVRLAGVEAPRRGASCRAANGSSYDCGTEAAAALGRLVRGERVACRLEGRDRLGLPQGRCDAGATAVNRAIVLGGWARATQGRGTRDNDDLTQAERSARAGQRGVWRGADEPFL